MENENERVYHKRNATDAENTSGEIQGQVGASLCRGWTEQASLDDRRDGEVIDIVKKNGGRIAAETPEIREKLVEEMADVLMYYNDVMICYGITSDELKNAYENKFKRNMTRW